MRPTGPLLLLLLLAARSAALLFNTTAEFPIARSRDKHDVVAALDGHLVLDGASADSAGAAGEWAYIRRWDGAGWVLEATLGSQRQYSEFSGNQQGFGDAVALCDGGDVALVGAPLSLISSTGAVYVFERPGGTGEWAFRELWGGTAYGQGFGHDLTCRAGLAVVGTPADTNAVAAVLARTEDGSWAPEGLLSVPPLDHYWYIGGGTGSGIRTIDTDGVRIATGQWTQSIGRLTEAGVVFVFVRDQSGAWVLEEAVANPEPVQQGWFGISVTLDGNHLFAAASTGGLIGGIVHVFEHNDETGWSLWQTLVPEGGSLLSSLGASMMLRDRVAVIGAPRYDESNAGRVLVYRLVDTGEFVLTDVVSPLVEVFGAMFGNSVAVSWPWLFATHKVGPTQAFALASISLALGSTVLETLPVLDGPSLASVSVTFAVDNPMGFPFSEPVRVRVEGDSVVSSGDPIELDPSTGAVVSVAIVAPHPSNVTLTVAAESSSARERIVVHIPPCESVRGARLAVSPDDATRCVCEPGAFATRDDRCELCGTGTYKTDPGTEGCVVCPGDLTTIREGATSADECVCRAGTVQVGGVATMASEERECEECPQGVECTGGVASASADYWMVVDEAEDGEGIASADAIHVFRCDFDGRCLGSNRCGAGYTGILCGECADGYGRVGQYCARCPSRGGNAVLVALTLTVGAAALALLVRTSSATGQSGNVATKVLVNYLQVIALLGDFAARWPQAVAATMGLAGALTPSSSTISFDCAFEWTPYDRFAVAMALPVVAVAVFVAAKAWQPRRNGTPALVFFLFLIHPSVVQATIAVMRCRDFGPAGSVLAVDLGESCESGRYRLYLALAVLWFVVYDLGLLGAVGYVLWRNSPRQQQLLEVLSNGYRPQMRAWEIVSMSRKLAIMAISVLVVDDEAVQLFLGMMVLLLAFFLNTRAEPFLVQDLHNLEDASLCVLMVTLGSAITFRDDETSPAFKGAMSGLVIMVNLVMAATLVLYVLRQKALRRANKKNAVATLEGRESG